MKARQVDAASNMILNPVRVPPFLRIDLHAIKLHGKVHVIAPRHAGHTAETHNLACA